MATQTDEVPTFEVQQKLPEEEKGPQLRAKAAKEEIGLNRTFGTEETPRGRNSTPAKPAGHTRQPTPDFRVRFDPKPVQQPRPQYYDLIRKSLEGIEENLRACRKYNPAADTKRARDDRSLINLFNCIDDTNLFENVRLDEPALNLSDQENSGTRTRRNRSLSPISVPKQQELGYYFKHAAELSEGRVSKVECRIPEAEAEEESKTPQKPAVNLTEVAEDERDHEVSFRSLSEVPGEIIGRLKDKKYEYSISG